jgi:hypothetical protein
VLEDLQGRTPLERRKIPLLEPDPPAISNTAIHLSRYRKAIFIVEHTLRPGDGSIRTIMAFV